MAGKRAEGSTSSLMLVHELREQIERQRAELATSKEQLDKTRAELAHQKPLVVEAASALSWALSHPDYALGGKHHQGAVATAYPALRGLNAAAGNTGGSSMPLLPDAAKELPGDVDRGEAGLGVPAAGDAPKEP